LFSRRLKRADVPRSKPRRDAAPVDRVDLSEFTPDLLLYLGQAAYVQLALFEALSRAVSIAPSPSSKESVSRVAALSLTKHHGLTAEIKRRGADPGATMAPFAARIDEFALSTLGADWYEMLVTCYLTAGLLDDFQLQLASGLPGDSGVRIKAVLAADDGHDLLVAELRVAIDSNPRLASRLAMWGRRLVGDTLLIARSSLANMGHTHRDEARLEPVFTELIAAHTRRMDALGLTA
jgi:hypothetical protein